MDDTVIQILFWLLIAASVALPVRYALVSYLLLVQIDYSSLMAGWASASATGSANSIKVVVVPTVMLLKLMLAHSNHWGQFHVRLHPLRSLASSLPCQLWVFFLLYVFLSSFRSDFGTSAMKQLGYFYSYTITFTVFFYSFRINIPMRGIVLASFVGAGLVAAVQTYIGTNGFGTSEQRFTAFLPPQQFAMFVAACTILLGFGWHNRQGSIIVWLGGLVLVILSGSNTVMFGFLWALLYRALHGTTRRHRMRICLVMIAMIVAVLVFLAAGGRLDFLGQHRAFRAVRALFTSEYSMMDIGTFRWRVGIYDATLDMVKTQPWVTTWLGNGTSSAAKIGVDHLGKSSTLVDGNRVLHNEFLRCLYEWGIVGTVLFISFLASVAYRLLLARNQPHKTRKLAIAFMPLLLFMLFVENIFAAGGTASGLGIVLVLAKVGEGIGRHVSCLRRRKPVEGLYRAGALRLQSTYQGDL